MVFLVSLVLVSLIREVIRVKETEYLFRYPHLHLLQLQIIQLQILLIFIILVIVILVLVHHVQQTLRIRER